MCKITILSGTEFSRFGRLQFWSAFTIHREWEWTLSKLNASFIKYQSIWAIFVKYLKNKKVSFYLSDDVTYLKAKFNWWHTCVCNQRKIFSSNLGCKYFQDLHNMTFYKNLIFNLFTYEIWKKNMIEYVKCFFEIL